MPLLICGACNRLAGMIISACISRLQDQQQLAGQNLPSVASPGGASLRGPSASSSSRGSPCSGSLSYCHWLLTVNSPLDFYLFLVWGFFQFSQHHRFLTLWWQQPRLSARAVWAVTDTLGCFPGGQSDFPPLSQPLPQRPCCFLLFRNHYKIIRKF